MRQARQKQLNLTSEWLPLEHAEELRVIRAVLDEHAEIAALVWEDLKRQPSLKQTGAQGLSAEQVLGALIIKQMNGFSYRALEFHLADSASYRSFCGLAWGQRPSKSALASCIKAIRPETLERINRILVGVAKKMKIEDGSCVRVDATVVETNIHTPLDSNLLWDCVRVLTRLTRRALKIPGIDMKIPSRSRRAKRRSLGILNARSMEKRKPMYRDLIVVTKQTVESAMRVSAELQQIIDGSKVLNIVDQFTAMGIRKELEHFIALSQRVIDQTERRVFHGESVSAKEKIVSIFEEHTDIIVKDHRETLYGHKICLTTGRSTLITDCTILAGNPADSTLAEQMIDRQIDIRGKAPRQAAFDGGFASKANLEAIKSKGVSDVAFSKSRSLLVSDMVRSSWVYRKLRNFRAGIEGTISFLKRIFGLDRCTWRSLDSFKSYVWSSVVSFNLLLIARHELR